MWFLQTHMPEADVERMRPGAHNFLDTALFTNVYLLYAPSQVGLCGSSSDYHLHLQCLLNLFCHLVGISSPHTDITKSWSQYKLVSN